MRVVLLSRDRDLFRWLLDILQGCDPGGSEAHLSASLESAGDADLCIWDYQPGMDIPREPGESRRHLFLVDRKHLADFSSVGPGDANVVLKPPTRASLEAFLSSVLCSRLRVLRNERDEVLQCLIEANLKLQEYDQDRTNFLARAVHDFRAPLTALTGYCGLLIGEQLGPVNEEQKEVLTRMQNSAKRLSRMASAMFLLSIGRHVPQKPKLQEADLGECIEQALHETSPFAQEKHIDVSVDLEPAPEVLCFETSLIEQVLLNLLDNACKFTPRSGFIEIGGYPYFWERRSAQLPGHINERRERVSKDPNCYRVDIRDSGPGIPEEHLGRLFEEYTNYGGSQDRSGGGLGLAICRLILQSHHGRIWAENSAKGATFSFVLPFYRPEVTVKRPVLVANHHQVSPRHQRQ